jgi:hypothetical protein
MDVKLENGNMSMGTDGTVHSAETPHVVTAKSWEIENSGPFVQRTEKISVAGLLEKLRTGDWPSSAELLEVAKASRRLWLTTGAVVIGLMAAVNLMGRAIDWARDARMKRQEAAIASLTPEHLMARCGAAAEDVSKEVYPIVMRTMTYQRGGQQLVVAFSKMEEEKGQWVFLSMKDDRRAQSYETTEAKIAAMPCLDSRK